jgi:hypothetical protein
MDKLGESFKAIVAVFHGIISTWLFIDFSEKKVDEFHFVILLVFFTVTNVLVWNTLLRVKRAVWPGATTATPLVDFQSGTYRLVDGLGLTLIAVAVGLFSAYLDRKDVVLWLGSTVANWDRTSSDPPFETTMLDITENRPANVDKRSRRFVEPARAEGAYLRVYVKDAKLGYEGYPGRTSTKGEVKDREVVLTPACRFALGDPDATKIGAMQQIEGPGVFLRLDDVAAIEIIDAYQSACAKLYRPPPAPAKP